MLRFCSLKIKQAVSGIGYAVGTIAAAIILTKGAGAALQGLKGIKAIDGLLGKLDDFKALTKVKVAEMFSDEAAQLAKQRLLKTFPAGGQPLVVLPGAPLSAKAIADFGVMVGNKIGKGATSFREIVKQMSAEVGEAVKPHLDELAEAYRQQMKRLGLKADESEITTIFKEWKADRAKNINEIIAVPKLSEIGGKGWAERQALRQKIGQADFADYSKHIKARDEIDAMRRSISGKKPEAQFLPKLKNDVREMYKEAIDNAVNNGLFKKEGGKWVFFHKFEEPIGYNLGKETKWLRVELTDNSSPSIHGHPTNLKEVRNRFPDVKGEK